MSSLNINISDSISSLITAVAILVSLYIYWRQRNNDRDSERKAYERELMALKIILGINVEGIQRNIKKILKVISYLGDPRLHKVSVNYYNDIYKINLITNREDGCKPYKSVLINVRDIGNIKSNLLLVARINGALLEQYQNINELSSDLLETIEVLITSLDSFPIEACAAQIPTKLTPKLEFINSEMDKIVTLLELKKLNEHDGSMD